MAREDWFGLAASVGIAFFLLWCMYRAVDTGVFRAPGRGRPVYRDESPGMFGCALGLTAIAVAVILWGVFLRLWDAAG